jgi:glycosyltransferase involved in cell wall biosynthesis
LRILFASKQHFQVGGVERSTQQLARRLAARGHAVASVAAAPTDSTMDGDDGRPIFEVPGLGYPAWATRTPSPAVALREVRRRFEPEVVVVGAGGRWFHDWTLPLVGACAPTPCVLYIRDHQALELLDEPGFSPDLIVANATEHARSASGAGHVAVVVPSLIEPDDYRTQTRGEVVLYVNPSPTKGVRTAIMLAASRPDIPFVFLQSWRLPPQAVEELSRMAMALGNIELLESVDDPRTLYARARVLLAPYEDLNRPRVVAEAQMSGIPVLARDDPALREAVGPGGVLVAPDASLQVWVAGLSGMWDDDAEHRRLSMAALEHSRRAEMDPDTVTGQMEEALARAAAMRAHRGKASSTRGGGEEGARRRAPADAALTSVILPVRDGATTIDRQLAALAVQDHPGPWELVVSDNGGSDDTRAHVLSWTGALPCETRIVDSSDRRGVAHARNVGIAASRGEYVLICDADDEVDRGWVRGLTGALQRHDIVTGAGDRAALNEHHQHAWMGLAPVTTETEIGYGFLPYASGGNLGVRRSVAEELGGFDERLSRAEDIDWSWRAHYAGYRVGFVSHAVARYRMRPGMWDVTRTRFKGGCAEPYLYRRHSASGMPRDPLNEVLSTYRWLLETATKAARDTEFRYSWLAIGAKRAGRVVGSLRHRTVFL